MRNERFPCEESLLARTHLTEWYEPFNLKVAGSAVGLAFRANQNIVEQKQMSKFSIAVELYHEHVAYDVTQDAILRLKFGSAAREHSKHDEGFDHGAGLTTRAKTKGTNRSRLASH